MSIIENCTVRSFTQNRYSPDGGFGLPAVNTFNNLTTAPVGTLYYEISAISIPFKTPKFKGRTISLKFDLKLLYYDENDYCPSTGDYKIYKDPLKFNYAICTSNSEQTKYCDATMTDVVDDPNQIKTGIITISDNEVVHNDGSKSIVFNWDVEDLIGNRTYYLMIWLSNKYFIGTSNTAIEFVKSGTRITLEYETGIVHIDNGSTIEDYLCYIDDGTQWNMHIPHYDTGNGFNMCY